MKKNLLGYFENKDTVLALLSLCLFQMIFCVQVHAQVFTVKGKVSTSTTAVRYASVTFEDQVDTTRKSSTLTDTSGSYQLNVILTSVEPSANLPTKFELEQNYPNPFSSSTAIPYELKTQSDIRVTIYDILGRVVRKITAGAQSVGMHSVLWDGCNNFGQRVATGIYFYRLQAGGESQVRKMVLNAGGNGLISSPQQYFFATPKTSQTVNQYMLGGDFTVRIENTDSTFPAIVAQQFDSVAVQGNATLDFTVNTNGIFPDPNAAVIYFDNPQQVIRGFGGANILQWRPDMTSDQVQKAFGSGAGQIGLSILRLRIPYDTTGGAFRIQIPTAKLVQSLGGIVFATPWTPPPAMKSNNNIVGGTLNESSYADFATYLRSFADYMAANGAPLYAVSVQNEPDARVTYESCSWNGTQFLNFMKNNAASIGIRVMMPESENFSHSFSDPTLNDSIAAANTAIIAGHLYGGGLAPYPLATSEGKELWMTEYLDTDTTWTGTQGTLATGVLSTGKQISDCMKAGMNAYVWWYTVRFYGPIDENGNVSKRGYVMSQFARFVRPGFTRVNSTDNSLRSMIDVTAYRNWSKMVLVAVNRTPTAKLQTFVLWKGTVGTFTPYVTSSSKNCEQQSTVTFKNGSFGYTLQPLSITTFVSN
jgi:glucuronoarabinoxylan endo-1,4-beta-xylanase